MELTKEKLRIIIFIGIAIIGFAVCCILYMPLVEKMKALGSQAKTLEAELVKARSSIDSTKSTKRNILLVNENETSLALDELTKQAKLHNINIVSIAPKEIRREAEYGILPIEIVLESGYKELGTFLGALDELQRSVVVVSDFGIVRDGGELVKLKTNLTLNLYISK